MIVETGQPSPYFILREVHYEQLSVQRIRQQQLDLDHPHRPAVPLLLRRLLILGRSLQGYRHTRRGCLTMRGASPLFSFSVFPTTPLSHPSASRRGGFFVKFQKSLEKSSRPCYNGSNENSLKKGTYI